MEKVLNRAFSFLTETNVELPAKYYKEGNKICHEKPSAVTNGTIRITEFQRRIIEKRSNLVVIVTFILPESDRETIVDRMFLLHIRVSTLMQSVRW